MGPVRLGNPPPAGQSVVYTRAQINELLSQVDSSLVTTNWSGASKIKITRRCRTLTDTEVKDLVVGALQKNYVKERGELELRLTNPWTPVAIPDDPLTVRILDLPSAGVTPSFIVRFELVTGTETVGQWQLPLTARIWRDVWVATGKVPRGAAVREAELGQERRDLLSLRDPVIHLNPDDTNLEFSENLSAGTPLSSRALRPRTVVFRGHVLDAIVQDGSLVISVKVEALENGAPGQTVRVRNINSKREFRGKVQNEETVLVSL
jgi:flagella basal body P-ring formation protein FlgA